MPYYVLEHFVDGRWRRTVFDSAPDLRSCDWRMALSADTREVAERLACERVMEDELGLPHHPPRRGNA